MISYVFFGTTVKNLLISGVFFPPPSLTHTLPWQTEGCDGVLGSGSVIDKCGVCGGRDSSCRKVRGSFQNATVPHGYHKILDIPAGATFINVTERRASPNYLGKSEQMYVVYLETGKKILDLTKMIHYFPFICMNVHVENALIYCFWNIKAQKILA